MAQAEPGPVLVVDDNAENRALAQATLEDEGFTVQLATSGAEALAAFARAPARPDSTVTSPSRRRSTS